MRSFLLLAAIPLATALPRGQPASTDVGVLERLRRLVRRGDPGHPGMSSATIPSSFYSPDAKLSELGGNPTVLVFSEDAPKRSKEDRGRLPDIDTEIGDLPKGSYTMENGQLTMEITEDGEDYESDPDPVETTEPGLAETAEPATDSQPAPVQQVTAPAPTATTEPSAKAAVEAPKSGDADQASYQTYLENLHNRVRAAHGNETPLKWSDAMYQVALAWASKCQFKHSDLKGAKAENIAFQTDAADSLEALKKSFQGWYYEEIPFVSFDEAGPSAVMKTAAQVPESQRYHGKVPGTVGHALNVLGLSYQEVGAASVFCEKLTTYSYDPVTNQEVESGAQPNAWFTVGSYNGQGRHSCAAAPPRTLDTDVAVGSSGGKLHAADGAVPALDSISY